MLMILQEDRIQISHGAFGIKSSERRTPTSRACLSVKVSSCDSAPFFAKIKNITTVSHNYLLSGETSLLLLTDFKVTYL
jgi:hypothetical protein